MQWAYKQAGITLPRTTYQQVDMPGMQTVALSQLQPGDLVFSDWGDGPNSHVAMYAGNNQLLEAGVNGVAYTPFSTNYQGHVNNYRRVPGITGYSGASAPSTTGTSSPSLALASATTMIGGSTNTASNLSASSILPDPLAGIANALSGIGGSVLKVGNVAQDVTDFFLAPARVILKVTLFFVGLILIILGIWMVATEIRD